MRRRHFLASTAAAAAGLGTLAGCTAPTHDPGEFDPQRFMATPAALGAGDHYTFFARDDAAIRDAAALAPATARKYRRYVESTRPFGIELDPAAVDGSLQLVAAPTAPRPRLTVLRGDTDAVDAALQDRHGPPTRTGDGRRWTGDSTAVHVTDETTLVASGDALDRTLDAALAARDGGRRYADASAAADHLLAALGAGHDVNGYTHPKTGEADADPAAGAFAGEVARGHRYRFDGETTRSTYVFVFAGGSARGRQVDQWVRANGDQSNGRFGDYERVAVETEGRVARVTGRLPTGEV